MNLPMSFDQNILSGLQTLVDTVGGGGGFLYMKMDKTGAWVFGRDNDEPQDGSQWVVNPFTAQSGFIAWSPGGDLLGERMVPLTGQAITQGELPEVAGSWKAQLSIQLLCTTGDDAGTAVVYKASSIGGVNVINALLREVLTRQGGGKPEIFPVVELESYQDMKSKYKTWYPKLVQKNWLDASAFQALTAGGETAEQIEEPAPEPTPEPVAPARKRRTRRTAA